MVRLVLEMDVLDAPLYGYASMICACATCSHAWEVVGGANRKYDYIYGWIVSSEKFRNNVANTTRTA